MQFSVFLKLTSHTGSFVTYKILRWRNAYSVVLKADQPVPNRNFGAAIRGLTLMSMQPKYLNVFRFRAPAMPGGTAARLATVDDDFLDQQANQPASPVQAGTLPRLADGLLDFELDRHSAIHDVCQFALSFAQPGFQGKQPQTSGS